MVRPGAARALIEGAFEIPEASLARQVEDLGVEVDEGRVVVRREVTAEGRSRAWINGSPATMASLAGVGALLVDLHGQHEAQSLLRPDTQRDILDAFADASSERAAVAEAFAARVSLAERETTLTRRRDEVRTRADYLRHVVAEIDRARVKEGEEAALEQEMRRLSQATTLSAHAERIAEAAGSGEGGAQAALARADKALSALERADPSVAGWRELLDTAWANLDELSRVASSYAQDLQDDPVRLAELERRRDLLFTLFQKYGGSTAAVLATRGDASAELDLLDTADLDLRNLGARRAAADAALAQACDQLSERRRAAAERMARAVTRWLPRLGMSGASMRVELTPLEAPLSMGRETISYVARLNAGLDERPLARVASGGELARIMLALKAVLARHDRVPTLVFDEVDQGIGGEIGSQVGEALAEVAGRHQVLVITHLPQVAARAERHLAVSKAARRGVATSDVLRMLGEDRVLELARMLGDPESDTARRHARAMLDRVVSRES
jgi:DNA repair protein RecN (Recombination protein N)